MTTKTIAIMEDAYKLLLRNKRESESFSEVIRRTFGRKQSVMNFAGALKHLSEEDVRQMKKEIQNLRKKSTRILLDGE